MEKHRANLKSRRETNTVLALSTVLLPWRACGGDWWQTLLICSKGKNSDVFGKATVRCTNQSSGIAVERPPMPCFEAVLFRRSRVSLVVLCMTHETNLGQDHRARSSPSSASELLMWLTFASAGEEECLKPHGPNFSDSRLDRTDDGRRWSLGSCSIVCPSPSSSTCD